MTALKSIPSYTCRICGNEVSLETCKTDEGGHIVHEFCYTRRLAGNSAAIQSLLHNSSVKKRRSRKEIAMDVLAETNRDRFLELAEELNDAPVVQELGSVEASAE